MKNARRETKTTDLDGGKIIKSSGMKMKNSQSLIDRP